MVKNNNINDKNIIDDNIIICKDNVYDESMENIELFFNNIFLFYKSNLIISNEKKYNKKFYDKKIIELNVNVKEYFDIEIIKLKNFDKYTGEFLNNYKEEIIESIKLKYYDDNNRIINLRELDENEIIEMIKLKHYKKDNDPFGLGDFVHTKYKNNDKIVISLFKYYIKIDGKLNSFKYFLGKYHDRFEFLSVKHINIMIK